MNAPSERELEIGMCKVCWLIVALAVAISLGVTLYDGSSVAVGVGGTPLIVACLVTDEDTGKPISGAELRIWSDMRGESEFTLTTDEHGFAQRFYPSVTSTMSRSQLGFTNTWTCQIPSWTLFVSAPGYGQEGMYLQGNVKPLRRWVEMPTLVLRVALRKK